MINKLSVSTIWFLVDGVVGQYAMYAKTVLQILFHRLFSRLPFVDSSLVIFSAHNSARVLTKRGVLWDVIL